MNIRFLSALVCTLIFASLPASIAAREPIIDMHLHALHADDQGPPPLGMCTPISPMPVWDPRTAYAATFIAMFKRPPCADPIWSPLTDEALMRESIAMLEKHNVIAVLNGDDERVNTWRTVSPNRLMPGLLPDPLEVDAATVARMRALKNSGDLVVLGELATQYRGISPDDPRLEPFWSMAEDLDLPVGIHVGTGPPGAPYLFDQFKEYRARLHSALTIEDVLVAHPRLRVYLMHAGYPMIDDLLAVLYTHPQVYVDVSVIVYTQPRAAFYRYLQAITDAGFGNRVMFGSDQMVWPEAIERSINVINDAPFLDADQKRDILYNNAARFLRLNAQEQARHRQM